ncbi:uncharacterized protein LOC111344882 [Stylophora pistillata]|uniref:uncharacterized protein LOC111344882 n=1 Tax=Stylophora pistillata TaxID=50429 RepID=UPI000C0495AF|nr:uncharacterized protein LOC111344882 [Stylophora pistillata]
MVPQRNQLVFVIAILMLCVRSVENIESCQKMTIKNCASNFHEIFQALEERNPDQLFQNCAEVQKSVDCLSVPRCSGDLLTSYRSLLIMTATLIKQSNLCPSLNYAGLKRYMTESSGDSQEDAEKVEVKVLSLGGL